MDKLSAQKMFDEKIKPSIDNTKKHLKPVVSKAKLSIIDNKQSIMVNFKEVKNFTKASFKEQKTDVKQNFASIPNELKTASGRAGYIALALSLSAFIIPLLGFITAPIALWYSKSVVKRNPKIEMAENLAFVAIAINAIIIAIAIFVTSSYVLLSNILPKILA